MGFAFLSKKKSFELASWTYNGTSTQEELAYLDAILESLGKESYMREYDALGFYSCQMIVPTLSEVYPLDDLLYNNKNTPKRIRDMVLNFKEYDPEDILLEIESLDETLSMERYIGVIFQNNFTMREFKAQTLLVLGESEEALELLEYGEDAFGHLVVELARMKRLRLTLSDYEEALYDLYTQERVSRAQRVLQGEVLLCDTSLHQEYLNILALFDRLRKI
jgi:ribosomal protein S12 methylthiotransferase accessory factor